MRFALVIFDLDGTLVDSLPDIAGALNHALGGRGLPPLPIDVVRGLVGEGVGKLAEKALAVAGRDVADASALADAIVAHYLAHPCVETRAYEGIEPALVELRGAGCRLAVLTNKVGSVARALLDELRLAAHFDAILGENDGFPRKPDPAAARSLFARFGEPALMVGDGLPDMALARAAGCASAAALWGYTTRVRLEAESPTFLVERPEQLRALVTAPASV